VIGVIGGIALLAGGYYYYKKQQNSPKSRPMYQRQQNDYDDEAEL
jgi:hypothetical protein